MESTQDKQRFLRQQILQSNYDPQEFIRFLCQDLHIEELDASLIDMKTLQTVVMKFKQYKYYQGESKQTNQGEPKQTKKVKIQYEKGLYDYEYENKWKCIQAESLFNKLQVFIPNFEVKQTEGVFFSIGSRTKVWYSVQSNITKQVVKRQHEDFQWLSDAVTKLYPLLAIPQLIQSAKDSETNYQKRRKELQEYLQILAKRQELKISNLFYDFLTLPADKIEKMKKNWDSINFAKGIQSIKNQQGYAKVSYTNKLRSFALNTGQFNRKSQQIHQKIASSVEKVSIHFSNASDQINNIVSLYAELHEAYNQLINKNPEQKINEYNQILININNMFHVLSENLNACGKIFTVNLKQFHKIQLNYDKSVNKIYRSVYDTQKDYLYFKNNLNRKKERIYPDVNRWEVDEKKLQNRRLSREEAFDIMLPRETQQQEQMKNWLAYLYNTYRSQFQTFISFQINRYVDVFCTLCSQLLLNNSTYVEQMTRFIEQSRRIQIK